MAPLIGLVARCSPLLKVTSARASYMAGAGQMTIMLLPTRPNVLGRPMVKLSSRDLQFITTGPEFMFKARNRPNELLEEALT